MAEVSAKARFAEAVAARFPLLRGPLQQAYERRFRSHPDANLFRGRFDTFAAAQASAPPERPLGYDNPRSAQLYRNRCDRIYPADYPLLFWLREIWAGGGARRVLDIGGHIGVAYYSYRSYLEFPADLRWTVLDVPAVVREGREFARERDGKGQLAFTTDWADADGADLWFASGSLQYLEHSAGELLQRQSRRPRHVLVNLQPLHASESFFTLQSIGSAYCPYRIDAEPEFAAGLARAGYRLRDAWDNPEKSCWIPFEPGNSLDRYRGFLFELRGPAE